MNNKTFFDLLESKTKEDVNDCIQAGVNINSVDSNGRNALFYCDFIEAVTAMIESGININQTDNHGNNALVQISSPEILNLLINHGIDIHNKNHYGQTCLYYTWYCISCSDILINAGIDINTIDNHGQTILYYIEDHYFFDYWVNSGCNLNHRDHNDIAVLDLPTYNEDWRYDFNIVALMRHFNKKDDGPIIFRHISTAALALISLLKKERCDFIIAENCTIEVHVKNMKSFFTELKKHTDIININFYDTYDRYIGMSTGVEMVKWFIRNDIRIDTDKMTRHPKFNQICEYVSKRERKGLLAVMRPSLSKPPQKRRL